MYGTSLSNTRNEPGINPQSRPRNPPLNVMADSLPQSFLRPTCEFGSLFSPLVLLSGIWPHSFPRLALKLCMLRRRH